MKPKNILLAATTALALLLPFASQADGFPERPVKLVVPVPPGGSGDIVGRLLAAAAGRELGQTIVIDNRAGAAGSVGTAMALKSPPDGYTLVQCSIGSCAINPSLYKNVGYDLFRDM